MTSPSFRMSPMLGFSLLLVLACAAAMSVLVSPLVCAAIVLGAGCLVFAAMQIELVLVAWIAVGAILPNMRLSEYQESAGFGFTLAGEFLLVFLPAALYQLSIARRYGKQALTPFVPVILYAAATFLWLPWAAEVVPAIRRSLYWIAFLVFTAIAFHYGQRPEGRRRLIGAMVLASLIVCAVAAFQLVFGVGIDNPTKGLMRGLFDHKNILGYFLVTLLPVFTALGFVATGVRRVGWFVLNGVVLLTLFFSLSRAAWLAGVASLLVVLFLVGRKKQWTLALGLSALLIVTTTCAWLVLREDLYGRSWQFRSFVASRAIDMGTYSTRAQVWNGLLYYVSKHPSQWAFGHGTGAAPGIINSVSYMPHVNSTHNQYLRLFVENGALGLAFFLALAGWLVVQLLRCRRACSEPTDRALCVAALGSFVAHLVFNFAGDEFNGMSVTPYLWVLVGLAFAARARALESARRPRNRSTIAALSGRATSEETSQESYELLPVAPTPSTSMLVNRVSSWNGEPDERS